MNSGFGVGRIWLKLWAAVLSLGVVLALAPLASVAGGWEGAAAPVTAKAPVASPQPIVMEAVIPSVHAGQQHVVFVLPPDYGEVGASYPAVLAFAGLGESVRGNKAGAWGWVEKYGVVEAMSALHRGGPLTSQDFQGLVKGEALAAYNAVLEEDPYEGVVLVCPFPPNVLRGPVARPDYERYLLEELIPYTRKHLRVSGAASGWGVDGISLGGLLSTYIGFKYPDEFAAIGSQQGSINSRRALISGLRARNHEALSRTRLNVATSRKDGFRRGLEAFSRRLSEHGLSHRFTVLPGRHDKRFVKGPGSFELLLFQERALRGRGRLPPARP